MEHDGLNKKVRNIMTTRMVAATREYNARDLAVLLQLGTFSGIPIVDPGNKLVGIVTEFDVLHAILDGKDLHTLKAEDIMIANPISVDAHQTVQEVMTLMIAHRIIRLPVVRDGKLIGMIARTDIIDHLVAPHILNVYGGSA